MKRPRASVPKSGEFKLVPKNWNPTNFQVRQASEDPIALTKPKGIYYSVPTTKNNVRVNLTPESFTKLVDSRLNKVISPWNILLFNNRYVLFKNPITRQNVTAANVEVFVSPPKKKHKH